MKNFKTLMAAALLVAAPTFLTSCEEDPWYEEPWNYEDQWWSDYNGGNWGWNNDNWNNGGNYNGNDDNTLLTEAEVLNGEWDGTMVYTNGDDGTSSTFYANMTFVRNNSNSIKGTGTEYDYVLDNNNEVVDEQTLKFNWYIDESTGDIYVRYTGSGSTYVMDISATQHGFYLDDDSGVFRGYMIGTNNKDMIYFDFKRVTNNDAKQATRATSFSSFGSNLVKSLKGGATGLSKRR